MKFRSLIREVRRDITSGTTRFALLGISLALVICGLICADSLMILQQLRSAEAFRASGAATLILEAPGRIDGMACEALGTLPGVNAAGALRESTGKVTIVVLPDAPVPEYEVTRGIPSLLSARSNNQSGLGVSQDLADSLGADLGDPITTTQGEVPVTAIYPYPADGRRQGLGYAVLSVTNGRGAFDECWVSAWPQISNLQSVLFATLRAGASDTKNSPKITQLNPSLGSNFAGNDLFLSRITRVAPLVAFTVGLALGYGAIRARRLQLASALHIGVSRQDLTYLQLLQALAWVTSATVIGLGAAALLAHFASVDDAMPLFLQQIAISLAAFTGTLLGVLIATVSIHEKQLFRYFKDR